MAPRQEVRKRFQKNNKSGPGKGKKTSWIGRGQNWTYLSVIWRFSVRKY